MTDKSALDKLLQNMPSPMEQAQADFAFIMEHGTPAQKETLMVIMRLIVRLKPGAHTAEAVAHATAMLHRAMS